MITTIPVGPIGTNCYLYQYSGQRAIMIDPGCDWEVLQGKMNDLNLSLDAVIYTHGHWDHILAAANIVSPDTPIIAHTKEMELFTDEATEYFITFMKRWGAYQYYAAQGIAPETPAKPTQLVEDGSICIGDLQVLHTPGHTPGGICLYQKKQGILFSGDTIFKGARGRTDFTGGNDQQLLESIQKIYNLPESTVIYPGHGATTTVGTEKATFPL